MSLTVVHNISDRAPTIEAHSIVIGGVEIRPGKFQEVSTSKINKKHKRLHGSVLWFGKLPASLVSKPKKQKAQTALTKEEAKAYLKSLSHEEVVGLAANITPVVSSTTKSGYIYSVLSALFSKEHTLSPEHFFWLGRWSKLPNGDYLER